MKVAWLLALSCVLSVANAAPPPNAPGIALLMEAERMFSQGDNLRALSLFQAILAQDRNNPHVWLRIGELQQRDGKFFQALEAYAEIARIYPDAQSAPDAAKLLAQAHLERARIYARLAEQELAVTRKIPLDGELTQQVARAERALAQLQPSARRNANAIGRTVEVHHVASDATPVVTRSESNIPIIRGNTAHASVGSGKHP